MRRAMEFRSSTEAQDEFTELITGLAGRAGPDLVHTQPAELLN